MSQKKLRTLCSSCIFVSILLINNSQQMYVPRMNNQIDRIQPALINLDVKCPWSSCTSRDDALERANRACLVAFNYLKRLGEEEVGGCARAYDTRCQRDPPLAYHKGLECIGEYVPDRRDPRTVYKITLKECMERVKKNP
nr:PREDICTED: uncharacterized protein LOC109032853 [Bemisia tabaci]